MTVSSRTLFSLSALTVLVAAITIIEMAYSARPARRYTCAEIYGPDPQPGYAAVLPAGWTLTFEVDADGNQSLGLVFDQTGNMVCGPGGTDIHELQERLKREGK